MDAFMDSSSIMASKMKTIRKRKKRKRSLSLIQGTRKLILTTATQKFLGCEVSENVTGESPWVLVDKVNFLADLENFQENSDLFPIKDDILNFDTEQILIVYKAAETTADYFYVCVTQAAQDEVTRIYEKMKEDRDAMVQRHFARSVGTWRSLGSECEIDDSVIRNRSLYEVEIESRYPMMYEQAHFRHRFAGDIRDGYAEILCDRFTLEVLPRKRIDGFVQTVHHLVEASIQTDYPFPKNASTQCFNDCLPAVDESEARFLKFEEARIDDFSEKLKFGAEINLYKNDYSDLVINEKFIKTISARRPYEVFEFLDYNHCTGKMVVSAQWHPLISGLILCSYGETSLNNYVHKPKSRSGSIVHSYSPLLMWSIQDELKPKLIFETLADVTSVAYCPYNKNLVAGGCRNGHVCIWDVGKSLELSETEEALTLQQQNYRMFIGSFMTWFKNIKNDSLVPLTIFADISCSHMSTVTHVEWLPPHQELSNTGTLKSTTNYSYQFITVSLDGTTLFWDLKSKPAKKANPYEPVRRMRRLKRKPSGLLTNISPLKIYNRIFRPFFCIRAKIDDLSPYPITSFSLPLWKMNYRRATPDLNKKSDNSSRIYYEPNDDLEHGKTKQQFCMGTSDGYVITASWESLEFSSQDSVTEQSCNIIDISRFHDGPIVTIERWPYSDNIFLTVGGKVFCIWKEDAMNHPIVSRRSRVSYSFGSWLFDLSSVILLKFDGTYEIWNFTVDSTQPILVDTVAAQLLSGIWLQRIFPHLKQSGIGDIVGAFRVFNHDAEVNKEENNKALLDFFLKGLSIVKEFFKWQENIAMEAERKRQEEEEARALSEQQKKELEMLKHVAELAQQKLKRKKISKYTISKGKSPDEVMKEIREKEWKDREIEHMAQMHMKQLQLDPKKLREQYEPQRLINEEEARKKSKQAFKNRQAEKIFVDVVSMHVPQMLEKKQPPVQSPYEKKFSHDEKMEVLEKYLAQQSDNTAYIAKHPFIHHINWVTLLKSGTKYQKTRSSLKAESSRYIQKKERKEIRIENKEMAAQIVRECVNCAVGEDIFADNALDFQSISDFDMTESTIIQEDPSLTAASVSVLYTAGDSSAIKGTDQSFFDNNVYAKQSTSKHLPNTN